MRGIERKADRNRWSRAWIDRRPVNARPGRGGLLATIAICLLLSVAPATAQWSAQPGETVRDDFGPTSGDKATVCRGACGMGCPSSCREEIAYECLGKDRFRRVRTHECGTHEGCRRHDDCLDRCLEQRADDFDCQAQCHSEAIEAFGFEQATSWATGGGPYDADPIVFEYTRDAPGAPEPSYRCPGNARPDCSGDVGRCVGPDGSEVPPVFDSYPDSPVRVSGFRSGRLCPGAAAPGVCEPAVDIDITGEDRCDRGTAEAPCTRYGFELEYENLDPAVPLLCSATGAGEDFLGNVVAQALGAMPADRSSELGAALGAIQDQLASGASLGDVLSGISVTPQGQAAPTSPTEAPPPPPPGLPREIVLDSASGHLVVPMYELAERPAGASTLTRQVRCTHAGSPVLETEFRLHFSSP